MNVVMDDAEEYHQKTKNRKTLGKSDIFHKLVSSIWAQLYNMATF